MALAIAYIAYVLLAYLDIAHMRIQELPHRRGLLEIATLHIRRGN
jgi:hypothetical protein